MLSLWPVEQWLPYAIVEKPSCSVLCLQAVDGITMHMRNMFADVELVEQLCQPCNDV